MSVPIEALTTGRMIPSETDSPPVEVSTRKFLLTHNL
jgi:hypothetical protein